MACCVADADVPRTASYPAASMHDTVTAWRQHQSEAVFCVQTKLSHLDAEMQPGENLHDFVIAGPRLNQLFKSLDRLQSAICTLYCELKFLLCRLPGGNHGEAAITAATNDFRMSTNWS